MKGYRNLHSVASGMIGLLSCLLLYACENDGYPVEGGREDICDNICFGISQDGTAGTRSASGAGDKNGHMTNRFVLRGDNGTDTLCVRASVSEGISVSRLTGEKAATRSTPVTEADFYTEFKVLAHCRKAGQILPQLYMNETARDNGNDVWKTTGNIYYWPGSGHELQFYAYAPADADLSAPVSPQSTVLENFKVAADVAEQKDVVVATTGYLDGNNNQIVPLTFKHICTAVRFVVGNDIQPGIIRSITLKGIKGVGSYDMAASSWKIEDVTTDFTQSPGRVTDGNTVTGDAVTTPEGTFMMLPQVLAEGAVAEVVFHDNRTGQDRILSASIAGQEWPMGKTVTYRLSISSEYELEFTSEPAKRDAHYVICPVEIKVDERLSGQNWVVESDRSWVTLRTDLTQFEQEGYWIDATDDKRTTKITGNATGSVTVYAFLEESYPLTEERTATLSLRLASTDAVSDRFEIKQLPAVSCGNFVCERLEENKPVPWGFAWKGISEDFETSQGGAGHIPPGQEKQYIAAIKKEFPDIGKYGYISFSPENGILVRIDYSKITIKVATDEGDGYANTRELYGFNGINEITSIKDFLISIGAVYTLHSGSADISNPNEYAVLTALKKNKFNIREDHVSVNGTTTTVLKVVLQDENLNWYLPAKDQYTMITDNTYPLDGNYWTSTAIVKELDNTYSYMYTAGGSGGNVSGQYRGNDYKVRAIRRR